MTEQPKPRGRPRVVERGSNVSTWLPDHEHDRLSRIANKTGLSVSAVVRSILVKAANGSQNSGR